MYLRKLQCVQCRKAVYRSNGRINEAKKFGWATYCSLVCQMLRKRRQIYTKCSNKSCHAKFWRNTREVEQFQVSYCSRSCAAKVNNSKYPKKKKQIFANECLICRISFSIKGRKYCSLLCKFKGQVITDEEVISQIKSFYKTNKRIPFKKEFKHHHAARGRFGSWNNAIEAAGLHANPVRFVEKHTARDGHRCDSLTEKIIDDWLTNNKIEHDRNVPYPGKPKFTCDFVVGHYYVEFFGLENAHKRYTELANEKRKLAKRYNLCLIEIKPIHVFPQSGLDQAFDFLLRKEQMIENTKTK